MIIVLIDYLEVKTAMTPIGNGTDYYNPTPSNHWQPSGYT